MKKILAIAIAVGVSAPALADTKLYGQLHASFDALSGASDRNTVASNSSRIGVKGSTALNGGLKAIYQAEWGMDTGNGGKSAFSNRNQVVGVAGGFGAVLIGRHDTPLKTVGRKADLFWSSQLGQNRSLTNAKAWDVRADNVIAYQTPKMGGFQGLAAYITDIDGGTGFTDDNTGFSVNGFYNAGPLMLGAGYETHDFDGADDENAYRLMGSYKIGPAKIVGFYQDETNAGLFGGPTADATVYGVGLAYKLGAGTIKGQYYSRDNDGANALDPELIAIGYDHKLGSKTEIYGQYANVTDGKIGGSGHGEKMSPDGANGTGDAGGISVGIRHKF